MKLHLGVIDKPHADGSKSTVEVANILEQKYHVIETFYELHEKEIVADLLTSMTNALEDAMSGIPSSIEPLVNTESFIQTEFVKFIDGKEMEALGIPGVPTAAALSGVNHRFKQPNSKKNPPRPSFRDTGDYEQSFRAWFER